MSFHVKPLGIVNTGFIRSDHLWDLKSQRGLLMRNLSKLSTNPESSSMRVKKLGKSINYNYFENPGSFFEKFPYVANFLT